MMRLGTLLDGLPVASPSAAAERIEVSGVGHDSRRIRPGDLYVAIPGARHDGRRFAADAVLRGAVAVLGPAPGPVGLIVPYIEAQAPRDLLGTLAGRIYGHPDRALTLVGVTGTNGKSTLVTLLAAILDGAGKPAGVLGTLGYRFREHDYDDAFRDGRTTPEAPDLLRTLAAMRAAGASAAAMEVSSHALAQGRTAGVAFDVAVFTNLTRDHLDFHGDLESYFGAKRLLFDQLADGAAAVVHVGDPYGRRLAASLRDRDLRLLTYRAEAGGDAGSDDAGPDGEADVHVTEATLDFDGIRATVVTPRGPLGLRSGLLGRYNLENAVAAVAVAEALELPHAEVAAALVAQGPINGRLEPVDAGQPFPALVDYAHTPAAIEAALGALRELIAGSGRRLAVVFGCGGEKDVGKRAEMGRAAGALADLALATSDNPRGEDPLAILAQVEEGLEASGGRYVIEPDRRRAIREAVRLATDEGDWAVLIAGKGHEAEQVLATGTVPFSDHEELAQAVRDLGAEAAHG